MTFTNTLQDLHQQGPWAEKQHVCLHTCQFLPGVQTCQSKHLSEL